MYVFHLVKPRDCVVHSQALWVYPVQSAPTPTLADIYKVCHYLGHLCAGGRRCAVCCTSTDAADDAPTDSAASGDNNPDSSNQPPLVSEKEAEIEIIMTDYESIKRKCRLTGTLFEDKDFPASSASLYFRSSLSAPLIEWKRPKVSPLLISSHVCV